MTQNIPHVVIIGAGPVGLCAALSLAHDCNVTLLDSAPEYFSNVAERTRQVNKAGRVSRQSTEEKDPRPISLAYGTVQILQSLNVWPRLDDQSTSIFSVEVSEYGAFGFLQFTHDEMQLPYLGKVVDFFQLQAALWAQVRESKQIQVVSGITVTDIRREADILTLIYREAETERRLAPDLLLGIDGVDSVVQHLMHFRVSQRKATMQARVYSCALGEPHAGKSFERFTEHGVLALLPSVEKTAAKLVWTCADSEMTEKLDIDAFVKKRFYGRVNFASPIKQQACFALQDQWVKEPVQSRCVLMGNAAHTFEPLAAQGFNLSARDVAALSDVVKNALSLGEAIGDESVLSRYQHWRARDQRVVRDMTRGLTAWSEARHLGKKMFSGVGLMSLHMAKPIKRYIARQLMGVPGNPNQRLPHLLRGEP